MKTVTQVIFKLVEGPIVTDKEMWIDPPHLPRWGDHVAMGGDYLVARVMWVRAETIDLVTYIANITLKPAPPPGKI